VLATSVCYKKEGINGMIAWFIYRKSRSAVLVCLVTLFIITYRMFTMKKISSTFISACLVGILAGCATTYPGGFLHTEIKLPVTATSAGVASPKVGTASCKSILLILATGDCSIETARKNGGITTVSHVDWHVENTLGIIGEYTVTVYGK
jgi:hypothetical protein